MVLDKNIRESVDEIDAFAKLRDDQQELGELKRVVVSLLQNIDAMDSHTILIAATNHEHLLYPALWRRFTFSPLCDPDEQLIVLSPALRDCLSRHIPLGAKLNVVLATGTKSIAPRPLRISHLTIGGVADLRALRGSSRLCDPDEQLIVLYDLVTG